MAPRGKRCLAKGTDRFIYIHTVLGLIFVKPNILLQQYQPVDPAVLFKLIPKAVRFGPLILVYQRPCTVASSQKSFYLTVLK